MSEEKFWNKIDRKEGDDECWFWLKGRTTKGYGCVRYEKKPCLAHRVAFQYYHKRPIIEGMFLLHKCDKPACCRPSHLREGTNQENMDDMANRGRRSKGSQISKILTEAHVLDIRDKYASGGYTHRSLATLYNTTNPNIHSIIHRNTWTHI